MRPRESIAKSMKKLIREEADDQQRHSAKPASGILTLKVLEFSGSHGL